MAYQVPPGTANFPGGRHMFPPVENSNLSTTHPYGAYHGGSPYHASVAGGGGGGGNINPSNAHVTSGSTNGNPSNLHQPPSFLPPTSGGSAGLVQHAHQYSPTTSSTSLGGSYMGGTSSQGLTNLTNPYLTSNINPYSLPGSTSPYNSNHGGNIPQGLSNMYAASQFGGPPGLTPQVNMPPNLAPLPATQDKGAYQTAAPANFTLPNSYFIPASTPSPTVDTTKRFEGTIKTYNMASGFGFITCAELFNQFERDVFFNTKVDGIERPEVGLHVSFNVTTNERNQPQAKDVKLTNSSKNLRKVKPPPQDQEFHGQIRTYNSNLGYGFITCNEIKDTYDRDVFVHKQQFLDHNLEPGDQVKFKVHMNSRNQPQARDIEKVDSDSVETVFEPPPEGKSKFIGT